MIDLDEWLDSIGMNTTDSTPAQSAAVQHHHEEQPMSNISPDDFNDILAENGFQEPVYEEAEEEEETPVDFYENGSATSEDLRRLESHILENSPGLQASFESLREAINNVDEGEEEHNEDIAAEAVQSINEDNHSEHNPDEDTIHFHLPDGEVSVPIVHTSEPPQEVSYAAMEAFNAIAEQTTATPSTQELIPPNSPTLLLNDATSRFSGTEWYNEIQKQRIILAGCGGIGSWTVLQLARMNPAALFMYDDDIVEQANMSGQLYCQGDVGKAKVDAMVDMITSYTTMHNIYALNQMFTSDTEAGDIMICGFDNMKARKTFFDAWVKHIKTKPEEERKHCLFLDGRLSIDCLQVFCIRGDDTFNIIKYSKEKLFSDEDADATVCSMKQTTYLACMIGSFMVNLFTNHVANLLEPIIPYDLPFFTEYDAQNMIFKTIK